MRKRIIAITVLVFSIFSMLSAAVSGTEPRSFSYSIKKDITEPFKVLFVDKNSTPALLNQIQNPKLNLSATPELAYYLVFAVKQSLSYYNVRVRVSPFTEEKAYTKILPASLYISNESASARNMGETIPFTGMSLELDGFYGPADEIDGAEYYFFGFFYSFPETSQYIPGTYHSNVVVEVSGA